MWETLEARGGFIREVEFYKYLGIEFNKRCTFSELKVRLADKARRNQAVLSSKIKGKLSVKANVTLWEGIVRPGLEYGAEVWGASGEWEEGEMILRESGRRILGCMSKTT